ncbi:protein-glucosylgalactosylhydroxylysine glucosidase isoform X2 [Octopus sinensis]|uniref:Protein-glucosylgalactosylhydroxylysine glucosidase n=1 Tax=Octopus sinensis TaxID=2607531 RepID=A0A6P7SVM1_9MOLL|nr:protein-glucosylgalactosylhydroxylysine glucosidase isoform X2 [Octopus sinensis]XP_029642303.1 protein-glucosylgalactosylhydroxylysine glucosidase isoform X2 [Octopus sinensis]XP_036362997.1 protein-glucosylgalactosylhydroxylysine glucosidase isoform X2 [Octopus sinensis]
MLLVVCLLLLTCLTGQVSATSDSYSSTRGYNGDGLHLGYYQQMLKDKDILLPVDDTVFETDMMPNNTRKHPTVGNGYISTVVLSDTIFMNGLYNGLTLKSHRARIPTVAGIKAAISTKDHTNDKYALNVQHGLFTHVSFVENLGSCVETIYAHRQLKEVLVVEITLERTGNSNKDFEVNLDFNYTSSDDLKSVKETHNVPGLENVKYFHGENIDSEEYDAKEKSVHMLYTNVPSKLVLSNDKKKTFYFLTALGTQKDQVIDAYEKAMEMAKKNVLMNEHANAWLEIWKNGYIDVRGDHNLAQITYAAQYYILSALPSNGTSGDPDFVGLSPTGLAHGIIEDVDYGGHVFWDQDIWMFPPILMFNADLAKVLMKTRTRTLDAARARAAMNGHKGAMYPWESAQTGMETTNARWVALYEQHVTGDIAFAAQQYLYMTNDLDFFKEERGAEMLQNIAEFWIHRAALDKKQMKYIITGVMGPDEYNYPVDNSIYTNYIAVKSLEVAVDCLKRLGKESIKTEVYEIVKDDMYLPFDSKLQYHPEYDGYKQGTKVKQADVILLGFPLMMNMPKSVRYNDLVKYETVSDENGPAMTWSMFSIGWLELKNSSQGNANFKRNFKNVMEPFKMWSEYNDGTGAVNFLTGMGGFLQSLTFGYGGFRIYKDRLEFDPQLPEGSTNITLHNIDYRGGSFTLSFNAAIMSITLTKPGDKDFILSLKESGLDIPLPFGKKVVTSIERSALFVNDSFNPGYSSSCSLKSCAMLLIVSFVFPFHLV